ncbi:MAG TPA: Clp protease N-terminal domain-containing protein, partial [Salinivirgaceae bacterium]|nr:Clp protease N-terminal domain-containing protein [Salinivirgaceae bacterium]
MNLNQFTIKAQEAVEKSLFKVRELGQQSIEVVHLLYGLLTIENSVVARLIDKSGASSQQILPIVESMVRSYPKVTGAEPYLSNEAQQTLLNATNIAQKNQDTYTSVEHILLAIVKGKSQAAKMLSDSGVDEKSLEKAIEDLRGGSKVTSQTAEETYDALNQYAINLNQLALNGKLDPVIGRDEEIRRILQILSRRTK